MEFSEPTAAVIDAPSLRPRVLARADKVIE
jgi:hypothetical protein